MRRLDLMCDLPIVFYLGCVSSLTGAVLTSYQCSFVPHLDSKHFAPMHAVSAGTFMQSCKPPIAAEAYKHGLWCYILVSSRLIQVCPMDFKTSK